MCLPGERAIQKIKKKARVARLRAEKEVQTSIQGWWKGGQGHRKWRTKDNGKIKAARSKDDAPE